MNTYVPQSGWPSIIPSVANLYAYTFPSNDFYLGSSNYPSPEYDKFGFDPPTKSENHKIESFSPLNLNDGGALSGSPAFKRDNDQTQGKSARAKSHLLIVSAFSF